MAFSFKWNDVKFQKGVHKKSLEALIETFENISDDATENTEVITGALQASVGYVIQQRGFYFRGIIGYGGDPSKPDPVNSSGHRYAVYYELGTSVTPAHYTMTEAWDAHIMDFMDLAEWDS